MIQHLVSWPPKILQHKAWYFKTKIKPSFTQIIEDMIVGKDAVRKF